MLQVILNNELVSTTGHHWLCGYSKLCSVVVNIQLFQAWGTLESTLMINKWLYVYIKYDANTGWSDSAGESRQGVFVHNTGMQLYTKIWIITSVMSILQSMGPHTATIKLSPNLDTIGQNKKISNSHFLLTNKSILCNNTIKIND